MKKFVSFILVLFISAFAIFANETYTKIEGPEKSYNQIRIVNESSITSFKCRVVIMKDLGDSKYEKDFVKVRISEAELIAPLNEEYTPHAHAHADANRYEAISSFNASDIYFMTFTDKDGKPAVVFFEATEQMLKAMKYYNSKALVMTKTIR